MGLARNLPATNYTGYNTSKCKKLETSWITILIPILEPSIITSFRVPRDPFREAAAAQREAPARFGEHPHKRVVAASPMCVCVCARRASGYAARYCHGDQPGVLHAAGGEGGETKG